MDKLEYRIRKAEVRADRQRQVLQTIQTVVQNPILEIIGAWYLANILQRAGIVNNDIAVGIGNASTLLVACQQLGADNTAKLVNSGFSGLSGILTTALTKGIGGMK